MARAKKPADHDRGIQPSLYKHDGQILLSLSNPLLYLPPGGMDELLGSIRLSAAITGWAELSAPFGVDVAYGPDTFVLYEAHRGGCEISFDAPHAPVRLGQGDMLLLPCHLRHRITDSARTPCIDVRHLLREQIDPILRGAGKVPALSDLFKLRVRYGGGGTVFNLRMVIMFLDKQTSGPLINGLPGPILLKNFADRRPSVLHAIFNESETQPAVPSVTQPVLRRLAEALLCQTLQDAAAELDSAHLYRGFGDPVVARVIKAILKEPMKDWTLQDILDVAHMSRSALNRRFQSLTGLSPRHFVTHIRLLRASEMLHDKSISITAIAERANYASAAAFNRAFHKWSGMTPGAVRAATPRSNMADRTQSA